MHQKLTQNPQYAKRMVRVRSKTVEPVLGTLINFLNMKKINSRGINQANKQVLMAALTYNLKKYLKFIAKKSKTNAGLMTQEVEGSTICSKIAVSRTKKSSFRTSDFYKPKIC